MTAIERARLVAQSIARYGYPVENELIAVVAGAIQQAEDEARVDERRRLTADWLVEVLPDDILRLAAEKVTSKDF